MTAEWGPGDEDWWEECKYCNYPTNWFNIEVIDGVILYGWLHANVYEGKVCGEEPMVLDDRRPVD